jgi:hypothetical protein
MNATPDLHLPRPTTVAEGNGVDVGVTDDFDGQTRSGLTPVDIGADAGFVGVDRGAGDLHRRSATRRSPPTAPWSPP